MTHYPYCGPHMLERPEHYMFSPFGGAEFLRSWRASRAIPLMREDEAVHLLTGREGAVPLPGSEPVATCPLLDSLATACLLRPDAAEVVTWTDILLRKFEFAKRLRARYGSDLTAQDGQLEPCGYCRLALLLASRQGLDLDLRRLNALLKVNDLALSAERDLRGEACLSISVAREVAAVTTLARRCGATLADPAEP